MPSAPDGICVAEGRPGQVLLLYAATQPLVVPLMLADEPTLTVPRRGHIRSDRVVGVVSAKALLRRESVVARGGGWEEALLNPTSARHVDASLHASLSSPSGRAVPKGGVRAAVSEFSTSGLGDLRGSATVEKPGDCCDPPGSWTREDPGRARGMGLVARHLQVETDVYEE